MNTTIDWCFCALFHMSVWMSSQVTGVTCGIIALLGIRTNQNNFFRRCHIRITVNILTVFH